jgi:putative Holliday junction resolvase
LTVGRVLALDVGDRRIGVAVSDPLGITARPLTTLVRDRLRADLRAVAALVEEWEAACLVVGDPRLPSGDRGEQSEKVAAFVEALGPAVSVPIEMWDESFTTLAAAERRRERGGRAARDRSAIDAEAAAVILEEWLRSREASPPAPGPDGP